MLLLLLWMLLLLRRRRLLLLLLLGVLRMRWRHGSSEVLRHMRILWDEILLVRKRLSRVLRDGLHNSGRSRDRVEPLALPVIRLRKGSHHGAHVVGPRPSGSLGLCHVKLR